MSNPETTETASDLGVSASVCVVGVLAEALAQHQLNNWWEVSKPDGKRVSCSCKWVHESDGLFGWESGRDARAIHRAHVASVVAALPNIAVVSLNPVYFPPSERRIRFEQAATDIRRGHPPVGLYITAAVLDVLDQITARAAGVQA